MFYIFCYIFKLTHRIFSNWHKIYLDLENIMFYGSNESDIHWGVILGWRCKRSLTVKKISKYDSVDYFWCQYICNFFFVRLKFNIQRKNVIENYCHSFHLNCLLLHKLYQGLSFDGIIRHDGYFWKIDKYFFLSNDFLFNH